MKVGGRRELIVPAALAYGAKGVPGRVPPNEALVFVVDLVGA
jgi:FKBP-type peptidyl-prolyl cis-trans isomerase